MKAKQSLTKQRIHSRRKQVKLQLHLSHYCRREHESYSYAAFQARNVTPKCSFVCLYDVLETISARRTYFCIFDILEYQGLHLCQQDPTAWLPLQNAAGSLIVLNL